MITVQPPQQRRFLAKILIDRLVEGIAYLNGFYSESAACRKRNDPGNFGRSYVSVELGQKALRAAVRRAIKLNLTIEGLCSDLCLGRNMPEGDKDYAERLCKRLGNHIGTRFSTVQPLQELVLEYADLDSN